MKLYSIDSRNDNYQLLRRYTLGIDADINEVVHFIDSFNPNYCTLNQTAQHSSTVMYLTREQLENLGILEEEDNKLYVILNLMHPHQVLINNYGQNLYYQDINGIVYEILQGYAIMHEGYNETLQPKFSIVAMGGSGAYYAFTGVKTDDNANWYINYELIDHAVDLYGLNYLWSIIFPWQRIYYLPDTTKGLCAISTINPYGYDRFTINAWNMSGSTRQINLGTQDQTIWTAQYLLNYDFIIYKQSTRATIEEVFDDGYGISSQVRVDETPQSRYTINSKMAAAIHSNPDLYINFY